MSFPTAHSYIVKNMMDVLVSLEKNFLEPTLLSKHLIQAEKALVEQRDAFRNKEFSVDLLENEKENIKSIIERLTVLEKASMEKLNWANQFTNFLQANIKRK